MPNSSKLTHAFIAFQYLLVLHFSIFVEKGEKPLFKKLEVKQLREDGMRVLHYVCEVEANVNGTLEELRSAIMKMTFLKKQKMLFLTSKLETINPSKEVDVKVKEIFKTAIRVKILHGTGNCVLTFLSFSLIVYLSIPFMTVNAFLC